MYSFNKLASSLEEMTVLMRGEIMKFLRFLASLLASLLEEMTGIKRAEIMDV